jgi:selenocysteine lyase/cysteine desulfurase
VSDGTPLRDEFLLDPNVTFLNHGSFGACPRAVFERYQQWQLELERQPVLFLSRRLEALLADARGALGAYVGADPDDLVFVPNATAGVNIAAWPQGLQAGDEVLSTDLEYGALDLAWEHVCGDVGARYVRTPIRLPVAGAEEIVEAIWAGVGPRTRLRDTYRSICAPSIPTTTRATATNGCSISAKRPSDTHRWDENSVAPGRAVTSDRRGGDPPDRASLY